jgi:quercetin dioxygenase-like cupin family protein
MTSGPTAPDGDGDVVELGEIGTAIVFENEHVRVWEVRLEPREVQDWHQHHHPYLIVGIEGAVNCMEFLDGSEPRRMHETPGRVVYRDAGTVHKLTNVGDTRYVNRIVELRYLGADGAHSIDI